MRSLASVEVGGESFPYKTEPRCRVCSSTDRLDIERALVKGLTYERIADLFGQSGPVNARGVRNHVERGHVPINAPAVLAVAKARSEEVTEAISPLIRGAAANLSFAHAVVDRVRARLASGDVEPSVKDGLAAMRLITECEAGAGPADADEWQSEFIALLDAVREVMTPGQFNELATRLNTRKREREAAQHGR